MKPTQLDMFGDFRNQTLVMRCVAGHFIGSFSDADPDNPIIQKSIFYKTEKEAQDTLDSGNWQVPEEP